MSPYFAPSPQRTQVWSDGGGTQSCYLATLILRKLLPKPDLAVFVNTGREVDHTIQYHRTYVIPALAQIGVTLHVIQKHHYTAIDLTSKNGKTILLPAYTTQSGNVGKLPTFCSGEWKRDTISRWLRRQHVTQCDMWLGYSTDELRRITKPRRAWIRKQYPLIHLNASRTDCITGVLSYGWPAPPRSRCWMCPNQCRREWQDLTNNHPDDFERACKFEEDELQKHDPTMFLHESCKPLRSINFNEQQPTLFDAGCTSGLCFV